MGNYQFQTNCSFKKDARCLHELRRVEEVGQNRSASFWRADPEDTRPQASHMLYLCAYGASARMPLMREDGNHIGHLAGAGVELMGLKV